MSNVSISPDLSDMWHHGYLVNPRWEAELELDSASDSDSISRAMVHDLKDSISITGKCSPWILIRDFLFPSNVIRLRTAARRWSNVQFSGEYAALWFFFMTKNEAMPTSPLPEWPSRRLDYRDKIGFASLAMKSGKRSEFSTFGCVMRSTLLHSSGADTYVSNTVTLLAYKVSPGEAAIGRTQPRTGLSYTGSLTPPSDSS